MVQRTEFVAEPVEYDGDIIDPHFYNRKADAERAVPALLEHYTTAKCIELASVDVDTRTYQYFARIHRDGRREDLRVMPEPKVHGPRPQQKTPHAIGDALGNGVVYDDGGRRAAGRRGDTGDCVVRAVAIASGRDYAEVYDYLAAGMASNRPRKGKKAARSASHGVSVKKPWFAAYMVDLGFEWVPTMSIGSGCKVHLKPSELPAGRLIARVSGHVVAVVDGIIRDSYDCTRDGTRCVYGYWRKVTP